MVTDTRREDWSSGAPPSAARAAPEYFEGVLTRRVFAFIIDVLVIAIPVAIAVVAIAVFGLVTLGVGWLLYFIISPAAAVWAIAYYAFTLGGPHQSTLGMRVMELEVQGYGGGRVTPLIGACHAIGYWLSVSFLTPFVLLLGLFNERRRLLHDMVLGLVVLNNEQRVRALSPRQAPPHGSVR